MGRIPSRPRPAAHFKSVLVVGDSSLDVNRIVATLRMLLGYELSIRTAATANAAVDEILSNVPQLVIMDDVLSPDDTAVTVIPLLRRASYLGLIVIASRLTYATRTRLLMHAGAAHVMSKDCLDSASIGEVLKRVGLLEDLDDDMPG